MPPEAPSLQRAHDLLRSQYAEIAGLAGGLAHEIRNPLSTMRLNLELLAEELAASDAPRDRRMRVKLQTIQRECSRLEQILNDFLRFARAGVLELAPASLNDEVREFIEFYRPRAVERGIELSPHLAAHLPPVKLDAGLFRQVLTNLAQNAEQAMPDGGRLEFFTFERDGQVVLEMIDNGSGMDERTQARIFEAFFSTRPDGSGLGLPTVRKIVEAHGGAIRCQSEVGRGTRFSIALPAAALAPE